ncbi:heterokaryon incompatibility protein-domain-containing protein [Bisporella sp. PMI_857]|nr:heterokaryon incompatibility protein-domain-containing protein [Bisporella sp. PMI_857]
MENLTPSYSYRLVDPSSRGFRLAILQPSAHFPASITCNLVEVTLDDHPIYEALSYAWGDPKIQATLQIEGASLKVTTNLELALRYLRLPDRPRTIWVDAICIDQSNIKERNQQVGLMKGIYSSCAVDLVWIGESDECTQSVIDAVRRMKSLNLQRLTDRGAKDFGIIGSDKLVSLSKLGLDDIGSRGLPELLEYPTLWERVWVMQEIACCPRAVLVVGKLTLPWETLSSILDHSGTPDRYHLPFSHQRYDKDIWDAFSKVQVIEHQREALNLTVPINSTLLDVLSRFRATYSTDPRDKIYGLLGLATDNLDIIPDYKKTPQEVYIDVARAQINSAQNLDIITQSLWPLGHTSSTAPCAEWRYSGNPSSLVENLPSWLPNFSCTIAKKILFAQRSIFSAGAEKCKCPIQIGPDGTLSVTGIVLGAIKTMKPTREMVYSSGNYFSPWARDWMPDGFADPNSEDKSYVTGGNAFEAYWRTLMTDCLAHPSRRLNQGDLKKYAEIFNEWRQKTSQLPLSDPKLGQYDKYDGDKNLLYEMGRVASGTGISSLTNEWRFAELGGGLYAMVPWGGLSGDNKLSKIGDLVVAVDGGKVPLVLRERNSVSHHENSGLKWKVIGTAYAHGFMDGLASQWAGDGKLTKRDFDLI